MPKHRKDLLQGTLDLLILQTLTLEPMHGWGIAKRIKEKSQETLQVQQGSLYPALYRLQDRGLIRSRKAESDEGRTVRVYRLTTQGRARLQEETASWRNLVGAVELVLEGSD